MTVHVVPDTLVTAMISLVFPDAWSATWNWVGGDAPDDAAGNPEDEVTVHVSLLPDGGAVVPPEETVVVGRFANNSAGMLASRHQARGREGVS